MHESGLYEALSGITKADERAMAAAKARWDSIAKPVGSLGLLEKTVISMAGVTGTPRANKRRVIVMCADNGVVAEGVTQTDSSVTALVAMNMARGDSSVCRMARVANAEVVPVDIGMCSAVSYGRLLSRRIADGTRNMAREAAMTRSEAISAIACGIELMHDASCDGVDIVATGEMGIGNTTTSAAVASVLAGLPPETVTGRGAGLSDEGLSRKLSAVKRAIAVNEPDKSDPIDVIAKVGGLDIAGMCGLFLGGALYGIPVIIDGLISAVSALAAARLCPYANKAMLASHASAEPAGTALLDELGLTPPIRADMRLGEGTGAVCLLPLIDMALAVYDGMSTFGDIGIKAYDGELVK